MPRPWFVAPFADSLDESGPLEVAVLTDEVEAVKTVCDANPIPTPWSSR